MKNKHRNALISIVNIFFVILLGSCSGPKSESTGVVMSATIIPTYNGINTSSVDVHQTLCSNGTATNAVEYFADHGATALINASLINPSNIIKQMTVYIDGYSITYSSHADSPGAPPIQPDSRSMTFSFIASEATTTAAASLSVEFIDLIRKNQYFISTGGALNNYTATYTFSGHAENGVHFDVTSQTDFQIGSFNYCPAGYTPI